ncbi:hypothetical protein HKBW3S42_02522, partial [Candidatus Hakubella thermalkaliphila]
SYEKRRGASAVSMRGEWGCGPRNDTSEVRVPRVERACGDAAKRGRGDGIAVTPSAGEKVEIYAG